MNVAVIDIGSGSVGLALVFLKKGDAPSVRFSVRQEIRIQNVLDTERLMSRSMKSLTALINEMQKNAPGILAEAHCFLPSHLTASQTRIARAKFPKPTLIDEKIIKDIAGRELEAFKTEVTEATVVEQKIMGGRLNGYDVSKFKNKTAVEAELSILFTLADQEVLDRIRNSIIAALHCRRVEFHSLIFCQFSVIRDLFKNDKDFIFVNIDGEMTDIILARAGILLESVSIPAGKNGVIRNLIYKTGRGSGLAESMTRNYLEQALSGKDWAGHDAAITAAGALWIKGVKSALDKFSSSGKLPPKIFVLADPTIGGLFGRFLDSLQIAGQTVFNKNPEVTIPTSADLNGFFHNQSGSPNDLPLVASSIFVNKILNQDYE